MRWMNKGREFDELGEILQKYSAVYLFGAGVHGKTVYERYCEKISIKGFIDNDISKQEIPFCGLAVISPIDINLLDNEAIIITTHPTFTREVMDQLSKLGHSNMYPMQLFLPILDAYKFGQVCLPSISFVPTTVCNLSCKHCLNFSPYVKEHEVRSLEQLQSDLNLLFSKIDILLQLHISGGEPFTYPYLDKLIDYIAQNHKAKLGSLEMTTNGTILPSENLLNAMKNADLHLTVDDYCHALPHYRDKQDELIRKLHDYGISHHVLASNSWIDLAPFENRDVPMGEEQLCRHFDACSVPWQEYRNGKLWMCNYAAYAGIAGIHPMAENECFDLNSFVPDSCREIVEFRLGYSEKGYTEFCRRCLGYNNNTRAVPVAEQLHCNK